MYIIVIVNGFPQVIQVVKWIGWYKRIIILTKISYIRILFKVRFIQDSGLYRIPVYSGFGLDWFHWIKIHINFLPSDQSASDELLYFGSTLKLFLVDWMSYLC